jgi:hypothetical protein
MNENYSELCKYKVHDHYYGGQTLCNLSITVCTSNNRKVFEIEKRRQVNNAACRHLQGESRALSLQGLS